MYKYVSSINNWMSERMEELLKMSLLRLIFLLIVLKFVVSDYTNEIVNVFVLKIDILYLC